jgi:tetratricopeptide (TPR) repeat protein
VGEIPSAFDDFRKALHLSEKLANKGWVAKSLLALGYAHHLSGQLDEASEYYRDAYLQSIEIDDKERQALALNSIAHVFAIQSREHDALGTVQQAIELWKELISESEEHRFRLGQSYNTTGEIYVELDQPERSLPYFELAWNIFDRVEGVAAEEVEQAIEWKSRTRSGRGFARWMLGDLESARQDLEWAEQHATAGDMPSILHRLSHVHWDLKERGKAEAGWRESMRKARAVGDMFTEFNSLTDLARIAFERQIAGFDHWHDFGTWYENYCRRYSYPRFTILEGLLNVYMGNLALRADEIEPATDLYLEGLPLLVQAGTYADFNIDGQLESIEERVFPSIPVKSIRQVGEVLLAGWPRETSYVAALNYFRRWKGWTRKAAEPLEAGE